MPCALLLLVAVKGLYFGQLRAVGCGEGPLALETTVSEALKMTSITHIQNH